MTPSSYWPRTDLSMASSGVGMAMAWRSFTFSSRMRSASMLVGDSIKVRASTCMTWFWTMSRSAPAVS